MSDRRKDSVSTSTPASTKPKAGIISKPNVRIQNQLAECERLIGCALQSAVRWLVDNPSTEEQPHVLEIQELLAELKGIIGRRFKRDYWLEDGQQWSVTVADLLSLQNKTGNVCAAFVERLPKELPGFSIPTLHEFRYEIGTLTHKCAAGIWAVIHGQFATILEKAT